jgi:uracil-DNA glycosylase
MQEKTLKVIQDTVANCTSCDLHKTRTNTVFARGNPDASICFIGEAPGEDEDLQGLPFVGRSGKLLDKILTEMGLDVTKDIYVCNIIKCRPPDNRRPNDTEVNQCIGYLEDQLSLIKAKVIVALGNTAVGNLIATTYGITKIRSNFFKYKNMWLMPTYHPSFLLRNGSGTSEPHIQFRQDIQMVLNKVKETI